MRTVSYWGKEMVSLESVEKAPKLNKVEVKVTGFLPGNVTTILACNLSNLVKGSTVELHVCANKEDFSGIEAVELLYREEEILAVCIPQDNGSRRMLQIARIVPQP